MNETAATLGKGKFAAVVRLNKYFESADSYRFINDRKARARISCNDVAPVPGGELCFRIPSTTSPFISSFQFRLVSSNGNVPSRVDCSYGNAYTATFALEPCVLKLCEVIPVAAPTYCLPLAR